MIDVICKYCGYEVFHCEYCHKRLKKSVVCVLQGDHHYCTKKCASKGVNFQKKGVF